jgi:hypothetical protein
MGNIGDSKRVGVAVINDKGAHNTFAFQFQQNLDSAGDQDAPVSQETPAGQDVSASQNASAIGRSSRPKAGDITPLIIDGRKAGTITWGIDPRYDQTYNWNSLEIAVYDPDEGDNSQAARDNNFGKYGIGATFIKLNDLSGHGINEAVKAYRELLWQRTDFTGKRLSEVNFTSHGRAGEMVTHAARTIADLKVSFAGENRYDTVDFGSLADNVRFEGCLILADEKSQEQSWKFFDDIQSYADKNNISIILNADLSAAGYSAYKTNWDEDFTSKELSGIYGPDGHPVIFRPSQPPSFLKLSNPDNDLDHNDVLKRYNRSNRSDIPGHDHIDAYVKTKGGGTVDFTDECITLSDNGKTYFQCGGNVGTGLPIDSRNIERPVPIDPLEVSTKVMPPGRVHVDDETWINGGKYTISNRATLVTVVNNKTKEEFAIPEYLNIYNGPEGECIINTDPRYMGPDWTIYAQEEGLKLICDGVKKPKPIALN